MTKQESLNLKHIAYNCLAVRMFTHVMIRISNYIFRMHLEVQFQPIYENIKSGVQIFMYVIIYLVEIPCIHKLVGLKIVYKKN